MHKKRYFLHFLLLNMFDCSISPERVGKITPNLLGKYCI